MSLMERKQIDIHPIGSPREGKFVLKKLTADEETFASCNASKVTHNNKSEAKGNSSQRLGSMPTVGSVTMTVAPISVLATRSHDIQVHAVRVSFPSPSLSYIEDVPLVGQVSHLIVPNSSNDSLKLSSRESSSSSPSSKAFQDVHISIKLMEEFMELARSNTEKDLETCGVLGAFLKDRTFYVTTLIIPKQESTSSSCQALNEEEIYAVQEEQSLFSAGWIHTHPSQACFMSSIDLHTQYSYQVMLPEAVAIVMAPTDPSRTYGIFRLTDPGGTGVLRNCQERGFHPHIEPEDGSSLYEDCSNVYMNPNLRFEIIDLRCTP